MLARILLLASFICLVSSLSFLSNTLGSHMVLQRAPQKARLWGWTDPGAVVRVHLLSNTTSRKSKWTAAADGLWEAQLPRTMAGGPYRIEIKSSGASGHSATLEDILFGDVYLCSGQSNMGFTVRSGFNATEEIAAADQYPNIRVFTATNRISSQEEKELLAVDQPWSVANSTSIGHGDWSYFSAVCWFFGRDIYNATQVPVGLVASSWGGTIIEAWSSTEVTKKCPVTSPVSAVEMDVSMFPAFFDDPNKPNLLWNAMIYPLLRMKLNGFLWYQGEANVGHGYTPAFYRCIFPAMIVDWRARFENNKLPFYFVQLAAYKSELGGILPEIRLAQTSALELPYTGIATAFDLGDPTSPFGDIHPRNKQEVSRRMASIALSTIYNRPEPSTGPTPSLFNQSIDSGRVRVEITFDNSTLFGGLQLHEAVCPNNYEAKYCGFSAEIQVGGQWKEAQYKVIGDQFVLEIESSTEAQGVRYGYADYPLVVVYNQAGLPMLPFVHMF